MAVGRRPQPSDAELRAWIAVCEHFAQQARERLGVRLVRDDDDEAEGGLAACCDELAAFLRDLL